MSNASRLFARIVGPSRKVPMKPIAAVAAALLCSLANAPAATAGDAQAGHDLARLWCSSCHIVDLSGHGSDMAPPFPSIAHRSALTPTRLRAWLISPHPPMPNLNLSRHEIDDIVAYLGSLAPH
jgi:cytochrome c